MATITESKVTTTFTPEAIADARQQLFEGRRLRLPVCALEDWPLDLYLCAAVAQARHLDDLRAAADRNWQTTAWDFGRFAKAHPALIDLDSDAALGIIREMFGRNNWTRLLGMDGADADMAFDAVWNECWAIPGYDPLTVALKRARESTRETDPDGAGTGGTAADSELPIGYDTFLATSRYLQEAVGDAAFLLPCHKLASLMNCLPMTVSRYRRKAVRDGYLHVAVPHRYRPGGRGDATAFRYVAGGMSMDRARPAVAKPDAGTPHSTQIGRGVNGSGTETTLRA